jgi:hypothetical protein
MVFVVSRQNQGAEMAEIRQNDHAEVIATKRGFPIYDRNPSVPTPNGLPIRMKPVKIANGNRALIIGKDTGELLGDAHAAFFEMQAVDQGQFVKIYLAGIKNTAKLTKAGMQVFEMVYNQMRENPQTDKIELNVYLAKKFGMELSERTYQRGLRELLENEFLYRSPSADVFFVNIMYMFNGNRITLAKSYYLKEGGTQGELPFGQSTEQAKLPGRRGPPVV